MSSEPRIRLEEVAKRFGDLVAVQPMNLAVLPGQFVVILGPSGSGKTTALRLIAGLESPTQGKVFLDREDVTGMPPSARDIAFAFQMYTLYPHLSSGENVAFPLRAQGVSPPEALERAKNLMERLGIGALAARRPGVLSGGDQQRVSLARALIRTPKAYLLDEPLGNLDGGVREVVRDILRVMHNERGSTTVLVTHDQDEAMALADYLVVMRAGRIVQAGTPRQVYEEPSELFVAGFVGTPGMNLLRATRRGEWVQIQDLPLRLRVGEFYHAPSAGGKQVSGEVRCYVGVRPEHVLLSEEGAPCQAVHTETLGSFNLLEARAGESRLKVWLPGNMRFRAGEPVRVTVIPAGCRWFDSETGRALPWKTLESQCLPTR